VSATGKATLGSRTRATITAAACIMYRYDASLYDVYARAREQLDEATREEFAAPGTIEDTIMVAARGEQGGLR
jgi:hypothetical protein